MASEIEILEVPRCEVQKILEEVLKLPSYSWVARNEYFTNMGTTGYSDNHGHYCSIMDHSIPVNIRDMVETIGSTMSGCSLDQILINRYKEGEGIPIHTDRQGFLDNIVIPLTENSGQGYSHIYKGKEIFYEDRIGTAIRMVNVRATHRVNPIVGDTRYSLILLFGPKGWLL